MRDDFEAAILENPDDDAAYLVYADWLMAQGDPRGELIVLQHDADVAERARKPALRRAVNAYLAKHAAQLVGPLGDYKAVWRYGYVRSLVLDGVGLPDSLDVVTRVLRHPSCQFVVDLQIGRVYDDDYPVDVQDVIDHLVELRRPATVRTLDLGITPGHRLITTAFGELGPLVAALPKLRRIRLRERRWREPSADDPVHEIAIQRQKKRGGRQATAP